MMTPTDRSMPAVRITSVCPMPRMPMTITWVRIVEKLLAAVKREGLTAHAEQQAEHQHDEGNGGRIDVEEALQALERRELVFLEGRDRAAAPTNACSNSCGARRPCGEASLMTAPRRFLAVDALVVKSAPATSRGRRPIDVRRN